MVGAFGRTVAAVSVLGASLFAFDASNARTAATTATTGAETSVPYGWIDFCARYSAECQGAGGAAQIALTPSAMKQIFRANVAVNAAITPVADKEHFGAIDQWDYPTDGKGDCEDYALEKRRILIHAGFPAAALLMTVVKEKNGDGHSVLTLKTDHGDYVLDNLTDAVRPWSATPYRFVKRQSQEDPNIWVTIGAPVEAPIYVSRGSQP